MNIVYRPILRKFVNIDYNGYGAGIIMGHKDNTTDFSNLLFDDNGNLILSDNGQPIEID